METKLSKAAIQKLLHHRDPYLLIDEVLELSQNAITSIKTVNLENDFFLKGHFPHAPVVPGAMMQEMTTQSAGLLMTHFFSPIKNYDSESTKGFAIGVLAKIYGAKFLNFAKPHDRLEIKVKLLDRENNYFIFSGEIRKNNNELIMKNKFALTIISDEMLY